MKMSRCSVSLASRTVSRSIASAETLRRWRFYHEFAIGRHSPLRQPAVGYRSPVLDSDGQNLAAAFQTIVEIGAEEILHEILADAFPGCQFYCENEHSRFALKMRREGIRRPLLAAEMSDGTLRFCASPSRFSVRARRRFWRSMNRRTACIATCCPRWPG